MTMLSRRQFLGSAAGAAALGSSAHVSRHPAWAQAKEVRVLAWSHFVPAYDKWIDGCNRLQAFCLIIIPVIVPGIITAGIFAFTLTYQEYIYALTFVSASANKTISYGVTTDLIRGDVFYWGSLMSGALIGAVPVAVIYAFSLDHFIHGLTAGALK